jgi:anti-anti-sigma factor
MERHLSTSTVSMETRRKGAVSAVSARKHTLILTGELTRHSAHALEMEIERLCGDGIAGITLDLRQLAHIDAIGAAVIAFRCGLCQRQGYGFSLIPGSPAIQRAFQQAELTDVLPFQVDEVTARRLKKPTRRRRGPATAASLAHDGKQPRAQ